MIKAILFDLSGVLFEGNHPIPNAARTINRLEHGGLILRFITNTSRKTKQRLLNDLLEMGFEITEDQLFTAPSAARQWCQNQGVSPYCLVHPDIKSEFNDIEQPPFNAVVLGDAEHALTYANLDTAFEILMAGGPLIAIGNNRYFKGEKRLHLDAGPFVKALEYASGQQAVITGKPSRTFFDQVIATTGCAAYEILMIGDDVYGDIEGARNAGVHTCLVKTGKYQDGDEFKLTPPADVANDVTAAVAHFLPSL
jgi:HAD superfamily hydrolase (TIGR01458 family)